MVEWQRIGNRPFSSLEAAMDGGFALSPDPRISRVWKRIQRLRDERFEIQQALYLASQMVIQSDPEGEQRLMLRERIVNCIINHLVIELLRADASHRD